MLVRLSLAGVLATVSCMTGCNSAPSQPGTALPPIEVDASDSSTADAAKEASPDAPGADAAQDAESEDAAAQDQQQPDAAADGGCASPCEPAATACEGNSVRTCGYVDSDTCPDWMAAVACPSGSQCVGGACVSWCPATCDTGCRNHALGKPYELSPGASVEYPDTWNAELTDDREPSSWPLGGWVGWSAAGSISITVDLHGARNLRKVNAQVIAHTDYGIKFPASGNVEVSDDGVSFRPFASLAMPPDPSSGATAAIEWTTGWGCDVARYVRFSLSGCDGWCLLSEVRAVGPYLQAPAKLERSDGVVFGAFHPGASGPDPDAFGALSGKLPSTMLWYAGWSKSFGENPGPVLDSLGARRMLLQVGWEPNGLTLDAILGGGQDASIEAWMEAAKLAARPLWVRMMSEMNSTWVDWGGYNNGASEEATAKYRAAWRRVVNLARKHHADNVVFVWSPNPVDYPAEAWNTPFEYYPGPDFVDWVGSSVYDDGGLFPRDQIKRIYDVYGADHPMMMSEGAGQEPHRTAWIQELFQVCDELPRLRAVTWFDSTDKWAFVDPSEALDAWKQGIGQPVFLAGGP